MNYISWALFVEGRTDVDYFSTLLPRTIEFLLQEARGPEAVIPETPVAVFGTGNRSMDRAAQEVCDASAAFHILFVHGDLGGRAVADQIENRTCVLCDLVHETCDFRRDRCVVLSPSRETEAWTLADVAALRRVLGLRSAVALVGVPDRPALVETLPDPKMVAANLLRSLANGRRRRSTKWPYAAIAQEQQIGALLNVPSFQRFVDQLKVALRSIGYLDL